MFLFLLGCVIGSMMGASIGFCIFAILRVEAEVRTPGYPRADFRSAIMTAKMASEGYWES